ncbi:hypothetical protein D9758_010280 [Tetrapyrgos nigripes]|uniref:BTB domain-containing protein n=1 Tax=Tetrapyrgos nigripes TaxID=182062 RepID=A0A8H5LL71_9AGAR|nr:hypothetical protein D9758_010280 [Tetrapyrgos nigripes]
MLPQTPPELYRSDFVQLMSLATTAEKYVVYSTIRIETRKLSSKVGPEKGGDVIFRSCDNVLFHVQQKHLEAYAEGFPLARHTISSSNKETVPLTEKAFTLELLFQFMLPQSPPELDQLNFDQLMELANASEKYVVYFARRDCALYMKNFISTHTNKQILKYAAEHDHKSLLYELAPLLVATPLEEFGVILPHDVFVPWSIYHSNYFRILNRINSIYDTFQGYGCDYAWRRRVQYVKDAIVKDPNKMTQFCELMSQKDSSLQGVCENSCCNGQKQWRNMVADEVKQIEDIKSIARKYLAKKYAQS